MRIKVIVILQKSNVMSLDVSCPSCNSTFKVAVQHAGKRGKCPKCGTRIAIPALAGPTSEPPSAPVPPPQKPHVPRGTPARSLPENQVGVPSTPWTAGERLPLKTSFVRRLFARGYRFHWSITVGAALVAVMIGYFLGREHVKYEIRSAISEAVKAFSEGVQESFGNDVQTDKIETGSSPSTAGVAVPDATGTTNTKPRLPDLVDFGKLYTAPEFEISLVEARIDRPEVKDLFGDARRGKNPDLILVFRVKNTHDRRILRYREENMFLAGHFRLRDDVDNVIRGVSYGVGTKPLGALSGSEDILPGEEVTHLEVFSVPPPKTKYLILTMELAAFGGEGETRFKIPVENIDNFPP